MADELKTKREILQHLPQLVVSFCLLFLFERDLLLIELWEIVISVPLLLIELILLVKMSNVRVCSLNIEALSSIFYFNNIVKNSLVDCIQASSVLRTLNFGGEIDLSDNKLSQKLKLADSDESRDKLSCYVAHVLCQHLIVLQAILTQSLEIMADRLIVLNEHLHELRIVSLSFDPELLRDRSSTD